MRNVLARLRATSFYGPGSILRVVAHREAPLAHGYAARPAVWFEGSPAFAITDVSRASAVLEYPAQGDPLLSG